MHGFLYNIQSAISLILMCESKFLVVKFRLILSARIKIMSPKCSQIPHELIIIIFQGDHTLSKKKLSGNSHIIELDA
jgi:hypothetical protein